jgi:hypothetical protein
MIKKRLQVDIPQYLHNELKAIAAYRDVRFWDFLNEKLKAIAEEEMFEISLERSDLNRSRADERVD